MGRRLGGTVALHVFLDGTSNKLRALETNGLADSIEALQEDRTDAHVDLLGLDLLSGHQLHGGRLYTPFAKNVATLPMFLAIDRKSYKILSLARHGAWPQHGGSGMSQSRISTGEGRTPGEVWRSHDFQRCFDGFLVTERGNIDRPIAYVDATGLSNMGEEEALSLAMKIATDPLAAGDPVGCMDLRHFGRVDSTLPVPGWIYGIFCSQVRASGGERERFVQPSPFCPVRLARLNKQLQELTRPASRRARRGIRARATAAERT